MDMNESLRMEDKARRSKIHWWQRNYLVNRDLQVKFAISGAIVGLFSSVVSAGLLLWSFWAFNIWQGQRLPAPILAVIIFVLFLNISGIYVTTIFATHRIVGPLFNLLRQFQRLAKADFSATARFREHDEMHYLARRFNEMVQKLHERNDFIQNEINAAREALAQNDLKAAEHRLSDLTSFFNEEKRHNTAGET